MEEDIVKCCEALLLHSSSSPAFAPLQWQEEEWRLQAAVKALGARQASPILLDFLRRPHLPDCVMDALSHSIALCCGSCSAPPSTLTFTFSPLLSVHSDCLLPKLGADEKFDWVIGSDLIYDHYNVRSLVGVIKRRLSECQGQGLFAAPVRENIELDFFLAELDVQGMDSHVEVCTEQEWETCKNVLGMEEGGTLHGVNHYEGGLVIVSVRHKPSMGNPALAARLGEAKAVSPS